MEEFIDATIQLSYNYQQMVRVLCVVIPVALTQYDGNMMDFFIQKRKEILQWYNQQTGGR